MKSGITSVVRTTPLREVARPTLLCARLYPLLISGVLILLIRSIIIPPGIINSGCLSPCSSGPPPTPAFTWSPMPACVGQAVTFEDLSTGTVNTRNGLSCGSPGSSTSATPTVTWSTPAFLQRHAQPEHRHQHLGFVDAAGASIGPSHR